MIKLTESQFAATIADKTHQIKKEVSCQLAGFLYRKDMEDIVYQEDVADAFVEEIRDRWDCLGWDDSDLVGWIRDIQQEKIEEFASSAFVSLEQFIADNYNSQKEFADKQGVKPPQITQWIDKGFVVAGGVLFSPRRELNL